MGARITYGSPCSSPVVLPCLSIATRMKTFSPVSQSWHSRPILSFSSWTVCWRMISSTVVSVLT